MDTITLVPNHINATNTFASHFVSSAASAKRYSILPVSAIQTKKIVLKVSKSVVRFSDPIDQKAWEAYKAIEPFYSDANRRLAQ